MFFEKPENIKIIDDFLTVSKNISALESKNKLELATSIIECIAESPAKWDKACEFNIKHIGNKLTLLLKNFPDNQKENIDEILICVTRFSFEFEFSFGYEHEHTNSLYLINEKVLEVANEECGDFRRRIQYAAFSMPISIISEIYKKGKINRLTDIEKTLNEAEEKKKQWDTQIEEKEKTVKNIKDRLDEYKNAFNFVGLHNGFAKLSETKNTEKNTTLLALTISGVALLTPPILAIWKGTTTDILHLIPFASLEIILIYFFRIILINYQSIKAQIIQIELRKTLCQFIQSYVDYSKEAKTKDPHSLEKFESLIFSSILSNPEKVPSTFDGINQISEIIKKIKN